MEEITPVLGGEFSSEIWRNQQNISRRYCYLLPRTLLAVSSSAMFSYCFMFRFWFVLFSPLHVFFLSLRYNLPSYAFFLKIWLLTLLNTRPKSVFLFCYIRFCHDWKTAVELFNYFNAIFPNPCLYRFVKLAGFRRLMHFLMH